MCWTQLSSIITIGTSIVIAGATWEIMKLNNSQAKVAAQKQKDDLFKIRWECYQEIIKYIKGTYEKNCAHKFGQLMDQDDKEKERLKNDFIKSKNPESDKKLDTEQYFLISKAKLLFDDKVAKLIEEFMYDYGTELISKSVYQISIHLAIEQPDPIPIHLATDPRYTEQDLQITRRLIKKLNMEDFTLSWLPSQEFEEKFDKYLKLE